MSIAHDHDKGESHGNARVIHTISPRSSGVETWSRSKPSLSSTRNNRAFQARTVEPRRVRPVAIAASSTARAASVAYPCLYILETYH